MAFDCKNELRKRFSRWRWKFQSSGLWFWLKFTFILLQTHFEQKEEHQLAVQKPKVREKKLSFVCKTKNYWKSLALHRLMLYTFLCILRMGLKYRDKQGEWMIDFRCNKNNHALCWGWQIRLSTLNNHHCPQPSALGNRACLGLTIWSITLNTGHDFYNVD